MQNNFRVIDRQYGVSPHGTMGSYVAGFALSVLLTVAPYLIVVDRIFSGSALMLSIVGLGMLQLWVQVVFFLHLSAKSRMRWSLVVFVFTIAVVAILAFGSLWIMGNLDKNMAHASPLSQNEGIIPGRSPETDQ